MVWLGEHLELFHVCSFLLHFGSNFNLSTLQLRFSCIFYAFCLKDLAARLLSRHSLTLELTGGQAGHIFAVLPQAGKDLPFLQVGFA